MRFIKPKDFTGSRAWDAMDIASMNGITIRMHWTDAPYKWHVNDGEEVFVVLDGKVEMYYKSDSDRRKEMMNSGEIFYASRGTEHVAHPIGEARILVIEKEGSI